MESGVNTYFLGEYADFVFVSVTPISLTDLSVFYMQEKKAASVTGTVNESTFKCSCQLIGSTLTVQADNFDPITITFSSVLLTAADVVSYINTASGGIVMSSGGFHAVEKNGFIVIETLMEGALSELKILSPNTALGFTTQTVFGTDQQKIDVDVDFQLEFLGNDLYAVTFLINGGFKAGESFFLFANITPPQVQKFKVLSNVDFVSVNFVS